MPAGSDVNRLLEHITRLEREVRDLRNDLADRENASISRRSPREARDAREAEVDEGHHEDDEEAGNCSAKGGLHADGSNTGGTARANSA